MVNTGSWGVQNKTFVETMDTDNFFRDLCDINQKTPKGKRKRKNKKRWREIRAVMIEAKKPFTVL